MSNQNSYVNPAFHGQPAAPMVPTQHNYTQHYQQHYQQPQPPPQQQPLQSPISPQVQPSLTSPGFAPSPSLENPENPENHSRPLSVASQNSSYIKSPKLSRFKSDFNFGKKLTNSPVYTGIRRFMQPHDSNRPVDFATESPRLRSRGREYESIPLESATTSTGDLGLGMRNVDTGRFHEEIHDDDAQRTNTRDGSDPPAPYAVTADIGVDIHQAKTSYIGLTIIGLAIYSTIFSIIFFLIAVIRPRYGQYIQLHGGNLTPTNAQLLSAIFAKTIELSFVSAFVGFLGQVLSRRALTQQSKGMNIAELTMRSWVTQPGSLITHASSIRFAGFTFLGILTLLATITASLYTTAADTLVSPKLRWGGLERRQFTGIVQTGYANSSFATSQCATVISAGEDPPANGAQSSLAGTTCVQIQTAGEGFRDLAAYMDKWVHRNTSDIRPQAPSYSGLVDYSGYWMDVSGIDGVNNVTLAMPHAGIVSAAKNATNRLLQPEQTDGYGTYVVEASVASPALNILCSALNQTQAEYFLVYNLTNLTDLSRNGSLDPQLQLRYNFSPNETFVYDPNTTPPTSASLFEPPRFAKLPIPFNSLLWQRYSYQDPNIYFITRSNRTVPSYSMCSIHSFLTPHCSSKYMATSSGGNITADCRTENIRSQYNSITNKTAQKATFDETNIDFKYIASELASSLSLGVGVNDANASVARLLSQLALDTNGSQLNSSRPSLAEALGTLFGNSLISSMMGAPFTVYNGYNASLLPVPERFDVHLVAQEYASGTNAGWQIIFYFILGLVVLSNVFCLIYFLWSAGMFPLIPKFLTSPFVLPFFFLPFFPLRLLPHITIRRPDIPYLHHINKKQT